MEDNFDYDNATVDNTIKPETYSNSYVALLKRMNVGDSFFVPLEDNEERKKRNLQAKYLATAIRYDMRVATRRTDGGMRIWRTL